jgi:membrane dipeptidase
MNLSASVSEEARRIHDDSIVIDGCTFFCEGYNDQLAQAGVTALNLTTPDVEADAGWAVREIASYREVLGLNLIRVFREVWQ